MVDEIQLRENRSPQVGTTTNCYKMHQQMGFGNRRRDIGKYGHFFGVQGMSRTGGTLVLKGFQRETTA